jgi:VCBS repeat-containing protein
MKFKMTILIILVSFLSRVYGAAEFNMTFSTVQPGGGYKPKNIVAAWVTKSDGTFVKTILRYAGSRKNDLNSWIAAAGSSDADAVMGATRPGHTVPTLMTATWDLKNKAGAVVPDGTYIIKLECADGSRQAYNFNFVKNGVAGTRTNPGNTYFKNISIAYAPPAAANTAPVANSQSVITAEDTAKAITLTASDAESNPLTYAIVTGPSHGSLSGTPPNVTYTPAANYSGADSFTFRASDGSLNSAPATVSVSVTAVNDAPVAQAQSVSTAENAAKAITLAATDVETGVLTYTVVSGPAHGTLSGTAPNITYTPAANYNGADSFTFRASDGSLNSTPATVSVTVTAVNDAPAAQAQSVSTAEDTAKAITLVATDAETSALTYAIVTGPLHGSLSGTPPNVTYTPAGNYIGADSFTFRASDGSLNSTPATVSVTVTAVNDAPVAQIQSVSTAKGAAKAITLAAVDAETNTLTYAIVTGPAHGTLSGTVPNLTYTPAANYSGADSFTFKANDGTSDSAPVTVSIMVTFVNNAPAANSQSVTNAEDTAKAITLTATDAETNALTYAIVTSPLHGALSGTAPSLTYTPAANYFGSDSFTFRASDGIATGNTATVSITVTAVNDTPVAQNQSVASAENTAKTITLMATDVETSALTYAVVTGPAHGVLSGAPPNVIYTPAANYNGADSFTFRASDASLTGMPATVSITVTAVNDAPVSQAQSVSTAEDMAKAITLAATDAETSALTYAIVTSPLHGSLSGTPPNVTYTPAGNYYGADSFAFRASDGSLNSTPATVSVTVTADNDAPAAQAQSVSTAENTAKAITLAATDVETGVLTYTVVSGPAHGTLSGSAPNLTYTPAANYSGADSFAFKANDGTADSAPVTVSINVLGNAAPVAGSQSVTNAEDTAMAITLVATDDGTNALIYTIVNAPTNGVLGGTAPDIIYTPATNYYGSDSFTFKANDGAKDSTTATVSIIVKPVNDAPVSQAQSVSAAEDTAKAITLAATDVETNTLTYAVVTGPAHGTLSGTAPNLTYTPASAYYGSDSFTFKANDGLVDSVTTTVSITVTSVNNPPVVQPQSFSVQAGKSQSILLTAIDVDSAKLTYAIVNGPVSGTLSGTPPKMTYKPNKGYSGPDSFTFIASDGISDSAPAKVSISVTSTSSGSSKPVALGQRVTVTEDTPKAITLAGNDPQTNALSYIILKQPKRGMLSGSAPDLTYTPSADYSGKDQFVFKVNNGSADSQAAVVLIEITGVNDAPVVQDLGVVVTEDRSARITLKASDPDSKKLIYTVLSGPEHGTLSGKAPKLNYRPSANYSGSDSFTFSVSDGIGDPAAATVFLAVAAVNDVPVAEGRNVSMTENESRSVVLSGSDADSDAITYKVVKGPKHGTLTGAVPNLTYTPNPDYSGKDAFTFMVSDGAASSKSATVSIAVKAENNAPVAQDQSVTTAEGQSKGIKLMAGDADSKNLIYTLVSGPAHGTLSGTAPSLTYTPDSHYYGTDSFVFKAGDGQLDSESATVFITVTRVGGGDEDDDDDDDDDEDDDEEDNDDISRASSVSGEQTNAVPALLSQAVIKVDGSAEDWIDIPLSQFTYSLSGGSNSVEIVQEKAVALNEEQVALLLTGCPFDTNDNVLVYFKLRLTYGDDDSRHSVDLWTSGSVLYGMVDGLAIAGLEAVLSNGVLEVKFPVPGGQAPSEVIIEEAGCGVNLSGGTLTELFRLALPESSPPIETQ